MNVQTDQILSNAGLNKSRKFYLDNIRVFIILGLFIAHSCEMYHLQDGFYIEGSKAFMPTFVYNSLRSWYMSVLFLIAGLTTMYSLKKRTIGQYYIERFKRLLVPFGVGIMTIVPIQAYFVMKNHFDFNGNILAVYKHFFTTCKDGFYGYDGGFTPAHLWFLIYLFAISLIAYPVIRYKQKATGSLHIKDSFLIWFTLLIYIISYGQSDESIVKYISFFIAGLLLYDSADFFALTKKHSGVLFGIGIFSNLCMGFMLMKMDTMSVWTWQYACMRLLWSAACTTMVFGVIGIGQKYLNQTSHLMLWLSSRSFAIYYIHMPVLIAAGYFVMRYVQTYTFVQICIMVSVSAVVTILLVELCRKIPGIRFVLGMK